MRITEGKEPRPDYLTLLQSISEVSNNKMRYSALPGPAIRKIVLVRLEKLQQTQTMKVVQVNVKRLVNNTFISLLGQAATWISTFALMIAYGRYLSTSEFGELFLAMTFVALVTTPISYGYDNQITRGIIDEPIKASLYFFNVLFIKIVLWSVIYGLTFLISWLVGYSLEVRFLIAVFGIDLLASTILSTFSAFHKAYLRTVYPVLGSVIEKISITVVGILILRQGGGVQMMAIVLLSGSVVNGIWQGYWFFRLVKIRFALDMKFARETLRANLPFLAYGVMGVIYYRIDTVLLSFLSNSQAIGWYGASYRFFDTLGFIPALVYDLLYPIFFKIVQSSDEKLKAAIEKSVNYLLFLGMPTATAMIVAAPNIIGFLYHRQDFIRAAASLQALAPGLVFLYVNTAISAILMSKKQDKKIPALAAIAMVFNVSINFLLIPLFQEVGAAAATSLTELLLLVVTIMFIQRNLRPTGSLVVAGKTLAASMVMALAIWLMHTLNLLIILPIAMIIYLGAATLLRIIPRSDLEQIYQSMRKKKKPLAAPAYAVAGIDMQTTHRLPAIRVNTRPAIEELATGPLPVIPVTPGITADFNIDMVKAELFPPEKKRIAVVDK